MAGSIELHTQQPAAGAGYVRLRIRFPEDPYDFTNGDLSATNARLRNLVGLGGPGGTVTPSGGHGALVDLYPNPTGTITVVLPAGSVYFDILRRRGNQRLEWVWDREGPVVSIGGVTETSVTGQLAEFPEESFRISFSEKITSDGFTRLPGGGVVRLPVSVADARKKIEVSNGSITSFTASNANPPTYTVGLKPAAAGTMKLTVPADSFFDESENGNAKAEHLVTVTRVAAPAAPPVIAAPSDKTYTQGDTITPFTFDVTDVNGDLLSVVLEGLPSGLQFGSNSNDARRTVRVRGTVATDAAVEDHTVTIAAQDNHHLDVVEATFVITVNAAANAWPVITNPGNKTYQQGAAITAFDIEVSDADGDTVTVGVTGLPPGLSYSSATGQVSGTVSATAATRFYYPKITANDGHHTTPAEAEFQIRVAGPPGISNPGDQTYNQGQPIPAFDITVTDPDDDPVTVGVTGLPPGLSYSTTTGQVSGTVATDAAIKDYTATITASDGTTEVRETFTITVNAPPGTGTPQPVSNRQPVITDPGDKTYARGEAITAFDITVTDDGDTVTVGVTGLPSGLSYSTTTGKVSGTVATDAAVKAYTATISANDGVTPAVTETFTVTVTASAAPPPANSPPAITDPGDRTYAQGQAITAFDITVTDDDEEDTVTVKVTGLPSGLAYSKTTGKVSGTVAADAAVKAYTATISASDSVNPDETEDFTVTVTASAAPPPNPPNSNSPPAITDPGDKAYTQGQAITAFGITVTDPDEDTVTVGITGLPSGLSYSTTTGKVSGTVAADAAVKAYTVTITASDGENPDETRDFTVTIAASSVLPPDPPNSNSPPAISDPGDQSYAQGENITAFDITVTDPDEDTVTVGVTGLPSGLAYSTTTGKVSGTVTTDAAAREYTATISASDGVNPDETEVFTVTITASAVLPPEQDNRPPAISDPGDRTYAQGETIPAFSIEAEDPDGDAPEVTLSGLPPGLGYAASSGQVSGTVSADAAVGSYPVTITASDAVATAVELTFSITVTEGVPTNRPPEFDEGRWAARDIGAHARGAVGAPVAATDPDGDALTYTVVESNPHLALDAATGQLRVRPDAELRPRTNLRIELGVSDGKDAVHEPQDAVDDTIVVTVRIAGPHPGLVLSQTAAALREGGEPVRYEATLASEPAGAVTVALASRDAGAVEVSPTELRFTRRDWSSAQPVTLHPVRDEDFAPERVVVTHDISSAADRGYDALADVELTATVEDPAGAPEDDPDDEDEDDPERDGAARPRPKRVRIVSVPAHPAWYAAGETIRAEVVFNGRVLVPGSPTLAFRVGAETRTASYLSGSGTETLLFEYRLPFGERDEDGVGIPQNALRGRIHSQAGEPALLVHPALPDDADHRVDAVRPTVSAVAMASRPASGDTYRAGETVRVRMSFDEPVRISGMATVSLVIGGVTRAAEVSRAGAEPSAQAFFAYRVVADDRDDDGVSVAGNSLSFAPGGIADRVGNPVEGERTEAGATRAGSVKRRGRHPHLPDQDGHKVGENTATPQANRVRIVSVPAHPAWYAAGEAIRAEVVFSEPVLVPGSPTLAVRVGAETRTASYLSGSGTETLLFEYRLPFGERDDDGVGVPENGLRGRIHGPGGEPAVLVHPALPDDADHRVDAVRPTVSAIAMASRPASGDTYRAGETVRVRMSFDEPVRISGTAAVNLVIGGATRAAEVSRAGAEPSAEAFFTYRVVAGDRDDDGVSVAGNSLSFAPGGIADRVGNPVEGERTEAGAARAGSAKRRGRHPHLPDQDGHKVGGDGPDEPPTTPEANRVRIVSAPAHPAWYAAGETIRAEVVFDEPVLVRESPTLAFRVGAETRTASYLSGSGTDTLLFEYRLPFGERDEDGVGIPQNALRGRIHSQAGEPALLVHPALPDDADHRVDAVRPTISAVAMASRPASGDIYRAGETVRVRMGFDEPVRISGTATVSLVIGGVTRAARISGMGPRASNEAVLAYRVMAGDRDDDGVSVTGNSLSFAPGVIADEVGNPVAEARVEADAAGAAHGERLRRGHHPHLPDQDGHKVLTEAPGLLGGLPDLTLVVGSPPAFVEAAPIFADARSYAAASSAAEIAAVAVEGSVVVVDPVAVGAASVRVLGSNPVGTAEQVFRVTVVDDPAERAVVKGVLWGLGRSLLASATATIGERLSGAPGGTRLPFPESAGRSSGTGGRLRAAFLPGEPEDPASAAGGSGLGVSELVERGFALAPGPAPGTSLRWSLWGAGDFHAFGGGLGEVSGFDGDLRAPYVGLDVAGDRWLAGVSASRAAGSADYRFLGASRGAGRLQVEMVNVFPYFRYSLGENSEVWTIVGGGRGAAAREGAGEQSDLALRMGAAGFRRNLRTLGPLAFSLRADAGIALLGTAGGTGPFANLSSRAVRYRLGFETSATAGLGRLGTLVPFAAFSGRHDGGDASVETGNGLELAGGVRFSSPAARVRIEAQGRMLAAHSGGYRERGFSLLAQVSSGPDGRGWTALVTPRLGAETTGAAGALWDGGSGAAGGLRSRPADSGGGGVDARVGYGVGAGAGLVTPFGELGQTAAERRARLGVRFSLLTLGSRDAAVELAAGRVRLGLPAPPIYRIGLSGSIRY